MKYNEKWQDDLEVYRSIYSTFIIEGMINDKQPEYITDDFCQPIELSQYLNKYFSNKGYDSVVFYNAVDKFHNKHDHSKLNNQSISLRETNCAANEKSSDIVDIARTVRKILNNDEEASVVVLEMASTYLRASDSLDNTERYFYSELMLASKERKNGKNCRGDFLPNILIILVEKSNDVPAWFYLNNPYVKVLTISKPNKEIRNAIISSRVNSSFDKIYGISKDDFDLMKSRIIEELVFQTEEMSIVDIEGVIELFRTTETFELKNVKRVIKLFKYGKEESEWDKIDYKKRKGILSQSVKGQEYAINKTLEVLARACSGLSDFDNKGKGRPRGVLFFAGPTGTGKTKLAKAISEMIFGDEGFVVRFDMSEFSQPHSDQRLIGAPPGYVGYNAGGELTNAVKEKPFCVLLFDEIEKADSSIMDKFLQILDDGRLTDSSGETVYFSETLIIFTSNLGVIETNNQGVRETIVNKDMEYSVISKKITDSIKRYFQYGMEKPRPELLSRIGDNFIVFDYIRNDDRYDDGGNKLKSVAEEILEIEISHVKSYLKENKGIELFLSDQVLGELSRKLNDPDVLEKGGRGIRGLVETSIASKIGLVISDNKNAAISKIYIDDILDDAIDFRIE